MINWQEVKFRLRKEGDDIWRRREGQVGRAGKDKRTEKVGKVYIQSE